MYNFLVGRNPSFIDPKINIINRIDACKKKYKQNVVFLYFNSVCNLKWIIFSDWVFLTLILTNEVFIKNYIWTLYLLSYEKRGHYLFKSCSENVRVN